MERRIKQYTKLERALYLAAAIVADITGVKIVDEVEAPKSEEERQALRDELLRRVRKDVEAGGDGF